ncbi:MAG: ATP-binding protein [Bacteroidota bacterium]
MNHSEPDTAVLEVQNEVKTSFGLSEWMLQRIRLLARRRIAWIRCVWQQAPANEDKVHDFHTEVNAYLDDLDDPEMEKKWQESAPECQALTAQIIDWEQLLLEQADNRLRQLEELFGLSVAESDLLQTCFALWLDPNLAKVFAYLQDHASKSQVSTSMVARLFGHGRQLLLDAQSPLTMWQLVQKQDQGAEPIYKIDPLVAKWLMGLDDFDERLADLICLPSHHEPLQLADARKVVSFLKRMLEAASSQGFRLCIAGMPGSGRKSLAVWIAAQLGLAAMQIDVDGMDKEQIALVYRQVQRQAWLSHMVPIWTDSEWLRAQFRAGPMDFQLQVLVCEAASFPPPVTDVIDCKIEMQALTADQQKQLWEECVPAFVDWPEAEQQQLINTHQATIGQIVSAGQLPLRTAAQAMESIRQSNRHLLGKLARLVTCPFAWDDLILPDRLTRSLQDFLFEAKERSLLWENPTLSRLFPQGKGLFALFYGPSGTGKTMAAQVIAASLGLDLFRIDMSSIVSKYVGETSKNLERILSRAQGMNAILLFDEADALFGKRTEVKDAHDRYANTDTNYLLQAIENYPGLAILSSNKKGNIDSAFMRRLRYVLEFPKPEAEHRLLIWKKVMGDVLGQEALQQLTPQLHTLAESLELTGAQIKYAFLSALFVARQQKEALALPHLLQGIEREMMKEGRGISQQQRQQLQKNSSTHLNHPKQSQT